MGSSTAIYIKDKSLFDPLGVTCIFLPFCCKEHHVYNNSSKKNKAFKCPLGKNKYIKSNKNMSFTWGAELL